MGRFVYYFLAVCILSKSIVAFKQNTECGSSVGCYSDCSGDCTFEVTWREVGTKMEFSMKASLTSLSSGGDWISVALSSDEKMGSDDVFDCITDGTQVLVERSENPAKWNVQISPRDPWITVKTNSYSSGILMCSFEAEKSNAAGIDFDKDWFMFFGTGEWNSNSKKKHGITPKISAEKVDLQKYDVIGGSPMNIMLKLHDSRTIGIIIGCVIGGIVLISVIVGVISFYTCRGRRSAGQVMNPGTGITMAQYQSPNASYPSQPTGNYAPTPGSYPTQPTGNYPVQPTGYHPSQQTGNDTSNTPSAPGFTGYSYNSPPSAFTDVSKT